MNSDLENPLLALLSPLIPFLIGLIDDALIIGFSRMGWNVPWLHWLAPIVLVATLIHVVVQFFRSKFFQNLVARKVLGELPMVDNISALEPEGE